MRSRIITIGCDPGNTTGLAMFIDGRIDALARVDTDDTDPFDRIEALRRLFHGARLPNVKGHLRGPLVVFATEDVYAPANRIEAALSLSRNVGAWCAVAQLLGCVLAKRVHATEWQQMVGICRGTRAWRAAQRVHLVRTHCSDGLNSDLLDSEDVQSAIMIGLYVHRRRIAASVGGICPTYEWVRMAREENDRIARGNRGQGKRREK